MKSEKDCHELARQKDEKVYGDERCAWCKSQVDDPAKGRKQGEMTCVKAENAITREYVKTKYGATNTNFYDKVCRVRNWDCKNYKMWAEKATDEIDTSSYTGNCEHRGYFGDMEIQENGNAANVAHMMRSRAGGGR
jgi:hypothetical protein